MACCEQDKHEAEQESVDNAQVAMADNGHIDLNSLQWTREPKNFEVKGIPSSLPLHPRQTSGSARTITSKTTMHPNYR